MRGRPKLIFSICGITFLFILVDEYEVQLLPTDTTVILDFTLVSENTAEKTVAALWVTLKTK